MPKFKFTGGVVGYLSYESVNYFENLNISLPNTIGLPESIFMLTKTFLEFDHIENKIKIITHIDLTGDIENSYLSCFSFLFPVSSNHFFKFGVSPYTNSNISLAVNFCSDENWGQNFLRVLIPAPFIPAILSYLSPSNIL